MLLQDKLLTYSCDPLRRIGRSSSTVNDDVTLSGLVRMSFATLSSIGGGTLNEARLPGIGPSFGDRPPKPGNPGGIPGSKPGNPPGG